MTDQPRDPGGRFGEKPRAEDDTVMLAQAVDHQAVHTATLKARLTGEPVLVEHEKLARIGYDADENSHGSFCGDYSIGAEPSNQATWALGDDAAPFVTVTETHYVTARLDGAHDDLDYTDWEEASYRRRVWDEKGEWGQQIARDAGEEEPPKVWYGVNSIIEIIVHSDVTDPGGSEVNSEYEYGDGSATFYADLDDAEQYARSRACDFDPAHVNAAALMARSH